MTISNFEIVTVEEASQVILLLPYGQFLDFGAPLDK